MRQIGQITRPEGVCKSSASHFPLLGLAFAPVRARFRAAPPPCSLAPRSGIFLGPPPGDRRSHRSILPCPRTARAASGPSSRANKRSTTQPPAASRRIHHLLHRKAGNNKLLVFCVLLRAVNLSAWQAETVQHTSIPSKHFPFASIFRFFISGSCTIPTAVPPRETLGTP